MPELSYREAVRDALSTAMREDEDVFIMGEDIAEMGGSMGVTHGMLEEFGPERVHNTPISEMALAGAAIGAAVQGMRPVAEIMYEDFMTLAAEQIVNQAAKHRYMSGGQMSVPVVFRTQGGAGWSPGAQHAQQLEAWFVHIPGLKVVFPSTPEDVRGLLWSSIYDDNPVVFFEHRTLYGIKGNVPEKIEPIPIGKARVHREGEDVWSERRLGLSEKKNRHAARHERGHTDFFRQSPRMVAMEELVRKKVQQHGDEQEQPRRKFASAQTKERGAQVSRKNHPP